MSDSEAGNDPAADAFERAYAAGILTEEPEATTPKAGEPPRAAFAPKEPFALRGCVLGPIRRIDDGYVVVDGGTIVAVGSAKPDPGVRLIDTGGVILPGLIDLHGHPEYNVFAAWEPPARYANRYRWRDSREYELVVKQPWGRLAADAAAKERLTRYAEIRALVGGVTAIQGATPRYPTEEALVRNVDRRIFGRHRARSLIDIGRLTEEARVRLRSQIGAGEVTVFYVHLAEGTEATSRTEFEDLVALDLLTPATVIIHGTALSREQLGRVKEAGAKLVWSPQSNLRLYGQTTLAAEAIALGIPVGLGADWLPSGSPCLLAELKVARRVLRQQGPGRPQSASSTWLPTMPPVSPAWTISSAPSLPAARPTSWSWSDATPTPGRTWSRPTRRGSSWWQSAATSPTAAATGWRPLAAPPTSRTSSPGASRWSSTRATPSAPATAPLSVWRTSARPWSRSTRRSARSSPETCPATGTTGAPRRGDAGRGGSPSRPRSPRWWDYAPLADAARNSGTISM